MCIYLQYLQQFWYSFRNNARSIQLRQINFVVEILLSRIVSINVIICVCVFQIYYVTCIREVIESLNLALQVSRSLCANLRIYELTILSTVYFVHPILLKIGVVIVSEFVVW